MEREKWSISGQVKKTKLLISNKVDSRKLVPGDHIYAYRGLRLYSHHGIYVGNDQVIHFNQTKAKPGKEGKHQPCSTCRYQPNKDLGVVKTCLDCFLSEGSNFSSSTLRRYQYEVPKSWYKLKRAGSCSTSACSKPWNEVIDIATRLYNEVNGFGKYNLYFNNCESFATYCKTGEPTSAQVVKVVRTLPIPKFMIKASLGVVGRSWLNFKS